MTPSSPSPSRNACHTYTDCTTISYGHTGRLLVPWCELQVTLRSEKWCACVCIKCNTNVRRCRVPLYRMLLLYAQRFNCICVLRLSVCDSLYARRRHQFRATYNLPFSTLYYTYACGATPKRVIITSCVNCVFFLLLFLFVLLLCVRCVKECCVRALASMAVNIWKWTRA